MAAELSDEVRALFEGANFGHVATLMPSGAPHSVAVWVGLEGDRIAFFTQPAPLGGGARLSPKKGLPRVSTGVAARRAVAQLSPWPADRPLRKWQEEALTALAGHDEPSFLASATPAAGKTTFGLRVAHDMLRAGRVARVAVVGPTAHICRQWAADAARYGIDLEPNRPNADGPEPRDRHGVAITYHAAWGTRAREAFGGAEFRLLLSGTPFRSDNAAIPWVGYDADGISRSDYVYGYPQALVDRVCRPVTFLPYDGEMEWVSDGRARRAGFEVVLPRVETARRLRTALDADGDWMTHVLRDADAKL